MDISDIMGEMIIEVSSEKEMKEWGQTLGALLLGGEIIELVGDVGAGKTTLTKGIATGMGIDETVQSPSFTISRMYDASANLRLAHYDFYRLQDAGIMAAELQETANDPQTVTIIEWAGIVDGALPTDRLTISLQSPSEYMRRVELRAGGEVSNKLLEKIT